MGGVYSGRGGSEEPGMEVVGRTALVGVVGISGCESRDLVVWYGCF